MFVFVVLSARFCSSGSGSGSTGVNGSRRLVMCSFHGWIGLCGHTSDALCVTGTRFSVSIYLKTECGALGWCLDVVLFMFPVEAADAGVR